MTNLRLLPRDRFSMKYYTLELQLKSGDRFKLQFFDFDLNILPSDLALNSL